MKNSQKEKEKEQTTDREKKAKKLVGDSQQIEVASKAKKRQAEGANIKQPQANVVREKKSKRQLKRERRQEQKSPLNLCPKIAKTRYVNACSYKDKCRFSHDIEAFMAQKPADLEGTHKDNAPVATSNLLKKSFKVNGLSKDVQKLLWKNKMRFTKADAVLKYLGLVKVKKLVDKEEDEIGLDGSYAADETNCKKVVDDSVDWFECPYTFE
ncbi:hypothetical protein J1N35_020523 [Gossypium stocksii]|uniref:C3H1-type domain-containing protein n=1 Tax=Gossypium stocksii TaxID=47602 RepID=A0A9D3VDX8_9ROSI|nr:hypothetical protein J1N35_020523 [Gossypium stocksii]